MTTRESAQLTSRYVVRQSTHLNPMKIHSVVAKNEYSDSAGYERFKVSWRGPPSAAVDVKRAGEDDGEGGGGGEEEDDYNDDDDKPTTIIVIMTMIIINSLFGPTA